MFSWRVGTCDEWSWSRSSWKKHCLQNDLGSPRIPETPCRVSVHRCPRVGIFGRGGDTGLFEIHADVLAHEDFNQVFRLFLHATDGRNTGICAQGNGALECETVIAGHGVSPWLTGLVIIPLPTFVLWPPRLHNGTAGTAGARSIPIAAGIAGVILATK